MGAMGWLLRLMEPFAVKPSGTSHWVLFWAATISGFLVAIATRPALGLMLATVPVSAMVLAILRVVPPYDRLGLWIVPALYAGVALSADAAVSIVTSRGQHRHLSDLAFARVGALFVAGAALVLCADVVNNGVADLRARPLSNYGLDDRRSVRLLLEATRPDDLIMTTHFGLAGLWWYGGVDISDPDRAGRLPNGNLVFQIRHVPPGSACGERTNEMDKLFKGRSRVAVYLGFRRNVEPTGFDNLVLDELGRRGRLVTYRQYVEESRIAVFDLTEVPLNKLEIPHAPGEPVVEPHIPAGCIAITPARRW